MQLREGTLPMSEDETKVVDHLVSKHDGSVSLTRRDPNESGPVLLQVGDYTYEIDGNDWVQVK